MLYFSVKEFFIPTLKTNKELESKLLLSQLNKTIQLSSQKQAIINKQKEEKIKAEKEKKKREEEERKRKAEEERKRKLEEEKRRKVEEEKRKKTEEEKRRKTEEEKRRKAEKERERKLREAQMQRKIDAETVFSEAIYNNNFLNNVYPKYPIISKKEGEEGEVILIVEVDENGKATSIIIYKSSTYERLDNVSIDAVKNWKFIPARNKFGMPIKSKIKIPFVFKIKSSI
jgi:TonB family protein